MHHLGCTNITATTTTTITTSTITTTMFHLISVEVSVIRLHLFYIAVRSNVFTWRTLVGSLASGEYCGGFRGGVSMGGRGGSVGGGTSARVALSNQRTADAAIVIVVGNRSRCGCVSGGGGGGSGAGDGG